MQSQQLQHAPQRINRLTTLLGVLMSLALCALVGRVVQLQISPDRALRPHMQARVAERPLPALRGELHDRRGRLLAASRFAYRAFIDPVEFAKIPPEHLDDVVLKVADLCKISPDHLAGRVFSRIAENERRSRLAEAGQAVPPLLRFVVISPVLDDEQVARIRQVRVPGLHLEQRFVREAVGGDDVGSIVGKVGFEHTGLLGAEHALNQPLQPERGSIRFVRDARGNPLWVTAGDWKPGRQGETIRLSIDLEIQRIAIEELRRAIEECDAAGGRIIVLDPHTGEILAMADETREIADAIPFPWDTIGQPPAPPPQYDPRTPVRYRVFADPDPEAPPQALPRNRCVEDVYEPGSTFKSFIWSVITAKGVARPDEVFDTAGGRWWTSYGRKIEDVTKRPSMTWADVLVHSSNIGMVKAGERLSFEQLRQIVTDFGFGRPTGIGLPGEASGLVTSPKNWNKYTHTSVCFGYEVAVTPVQMVRAFSVFAREGHMAGTLPTLRLRALEDDDPDHFILVRAIPADVALLTRRTMARVAENMQSRAGDLRRTEWKYSMFGKSGTADMPLGLPPPGKKRPRWSNGYFVGQVSGSFIAAGPTEAPRLVILAIIDDPGPARVRARTHYGSYTAGPVVRRVMERSLAYLGVPPGEAAQVAAAGR
ncbi:MAG: penicillin-binding protein 2 [Phycisphaeraceae bacterium]|nr:penicillin-binding protein 2 [Phycisphaeraceae bacterium]MCW5753506.1 penicillin-binding protein 2 [Phycisphaeraceae bacterium]